MIVFVRTEIKICIYYRLRLQSSSFGRGLWQKQGNSKRKFIIIIVIIIIFPGGKTERELSIIELC